MAEGGSRCVSSPTHNKECPVCLDQVQDPRVLPCSHFLCKDCFEKHIKSSTAEGSFHCPSCRLTVAAPEKDAVGLPRSFVLNKLKDGILPTIPTHKHQSRSNGRYCVNQTFDEDHDKAIVFCKECAEFYCQNCAEGHDKFRATRNHKLFAVDEISEEEARQAEAALNIPKCTTHAGEDVKVYCRSCKLLICTLCCIFEHRQHDCTDISEICERFKCDLQSAIRSTGPCLQNISDDLADLKITDQKVQEDLEKAKKCVDQTSDELCSFLCRQQKALQDQITLFENAARDNIEKTKQERQQRLSQLQSLYLLADELTADYDVVVHAPRVKEELLAASRKSMDTSCIGWKCNISSSKSSDPIPQNIIGMITMDQKVCHAETACLPALKVPLLRINRVELPAGSKRVVTGIATSGKYVYVSRYRVSELSVLTTDGEHVTSIRVPGLADPQGLTVVQNMGVTLAVSDHKEKKLHLIEFSERTQTLLSSRFMDLDYKPWGVSAMQIDKQIVVTDKENGKLILYSISGDVVKEVDVSACTGKTGLVYAERTGNHFMVTDVNRCQILKVNVSGKVVQVYQNNSGFKDFVNVWQAISDRRGNVLVADSNTNCLHLIDHDFLFKQMLLTEKDNISSPKRISICEKAHRLIVGHRTEKAACLDIFEYRFEHKIQDHTMFTFKLDTHKFEAK